jgi:hypothetical protein
MGRTVVGLVGTVLLLFVAAPARASEFEIDLRKPWVRPGGKIKARVTWDMGIGSVWGQFPVRWFLTDVTGRTVASGGRTARFRRAPYRFNVRARVPRGTQGDLLLHVVLADEDGICMSGSVPVLVWRRGLWRDRERETVTGTIVARPNAAPILVPDGSSIGTFSHVLYGSGVASILPGSPRNGARVTVTGRRASLRGVASLPMGPFPFVAEEVLRIDPPPEALPIRYPLEGWLKARVAPAELIGDIAWREFVGESRTPKVARTREEFDALNAEMAAGADGPRPLGGVAHADFGEEIVVVVFAGISPSRDYRVEITTVRHDAATETTWIEYTVTGPEPGKSGPSEWVEPYYAVILPARPGNVEFARTELLPDRPPWW